MQNADAIAQGQRDDGNRTVADLISAYEQGIEELRAGVAGMTAEQVRSRPVTGKWSMVGCRIYELCSLESSQLREGRLVFPADQTKGRKERKARVPEKVFQELQKIAGKTFLWERFADDRRAIYRRRKKRNTLKMVKPFTPARFKRFLQNEICKFLKKHPDEPYFTAHDFRRKAMTEAFDAGIGLDRASVAFGCHPETIRKHYFALDETKISDEVLKKIEGE